MRINSEEKKAILESVSRLDLKAEIYLFGSRTNDELKGGDIDLLIFSNKLSSDDKHTIRNYICDLIGEQKIDILIAQDESSPFVKKAKKNGVKINE